MKASRTGRVREGALMDDPKPKDHGEAVAIFRHGLIGELALRSGSLDHGERSAALRRLSEHRVRPPGSDTTRSYSVDAGALAVRLQQGWPRGTGAPWSW